MEGGGNKYSAEISAQLAKARALGAETSGWDARKEVGDSKLTTKAQEGSSFNIIRATGTVRGITPKALMDKVWAFGKPEWQKWSDDIEEWRVVETVDANTRVIHQVNKLTWPLWSRDAVLAQSRVTEGDNEYLIMFSVDHEGAPVQEKKYVRATVSTSLFAFEAAGSDTKVTRVVHLDPQGSIPSGLVNARSDAVLEIVQQLQDLA
eukprot:TRINITY_DN10_c0_g1_i1.p1 TRINITY_DN10_c0_g1~~TRINITY_DN10_c0_g1_i1.p1  ORF type:complete len:206 (-),score=36.84 TRINITY_DN10_c0_g1_i1:52-669(-)